MLEIDGLVFTMVKKNSVHDGIKEAVRHNLTFTYIQYRNKAFGRFSKAQVAGIPFKIC
jgi:chromosome partitioning protein